MRSFLGLSICFTSVLLPAWSATADVLLLKGGNDVRVVSDAPLGPKTQKLFREIDQDDDFAAFTVNTKADVAGTIRLMGSLESAVKLSIASCKQRSKGKGGDCELYAVVVPRDYPKGTPYISALNQSASRDFSTYSNKVRSSGKGYGAFVYSNYGEWAYVSGYDSKNEAIEAATLQCKANVAQALASTNSQTRAIALKDRSLSDCFTVDVRKN